MTSPFSSSSLSCLFVVSVMALMASVTSVESAQILGDAAAILGESDADRWTDISFKKLETQKEAHDHEFKVISMNIADCMICAGEC